MSIYKYPIYGRYNEISIIKAAEKSQFYVYFLAFFKLKFWNEVLVPVHT